VGAGAAAVIPSVIRLTILFTASWIRIDSLARPLRHALSAAVSFVR
jgi:hypothetical protein